MSKQELELLIAKRKDIESQIQSLHLQLGAFADKGYFLTLHSSLFRI
jgi:hypothetical protein